MNGENFVELLKRPEKVYELPLSQLELLIKKYPFSKNIQLLYLKKLNSLGLSQNEFEFKKYALQHQHPMMFSQFISKKNIQEEHSEINKLYQNIFDSINNENIESEEPNESIDQNKEPIKADGLIVDLADKYGEEKLITEEIDLEKDVLKIESQEVIESTEIQPIENYESESKNEQVKEKGEYEEEKKETYTSSEHIRYISVKNSARVAEKRKKKKKKRPPENKANKSKLKKEKVKIKKVKKQAKEETYIDWLDGLKSTAEVIKSEIIKGSEQKHKKKKKKKKKKKGKKLQSKINKSLIRNSKIYTETLAQLLEKQGHKKEAIEIYQQLMHNNPEKSDYFADRIDKLK